MVQNFGHPLLFDVLERGRIDAAEADEKHVRLRVGERSQAIIVLLAGRVEQAESVRLAADHHRHGVVVEHGRHVLAREFVGRVGDQQAGFAHCTVAYHYTLYGLHFLARI